MVVCRMSQQTEQTDRRPSVLDSAFEQLSGMHPPWAGLQELIADCWEYPLWKSSKLLHLALC